MIFWKSIVLLFNAIYDKMAINELSLFITVYNNMRIKGINNDMELQRLLSYVRKAVDTYQLIDEGDKIAVGISGGKDSLTLLYALKHLQRFYPKHFDLVAVTVDLGYEDGLGRYLEEHIL